MRLANKTIINTDLSDEAMFVYAGLKEGYREFSGTVEISSNYIWYILTGNNEPSEWQTRIYTMGINELIKRNMISCIKKSHRYRFVCLENLKIEEGEHYTVIKEEEYKKILNYSGSKNDLGILRLFLVIMSTTSKHKMYQVFSGTTTQEYQLSLIPMVYNTYLKYYKILEKDINLLYTYRPSSFYPNESKQIKMGVPNTYGRFCDSDIINKIGNEHLQKLQSENVIKKISKQANPRRAAAQVYLNWMGGKEYPIEKLEKTYYILLDMNAMNKKDYDKNDRVRDLSKFKQFEFYKGEGVN